MPPAPAVDQMAVWHEVDLESARHGVESATSALNDVYSAANVVAQLHDFDSLQSLPEGTVGVAVAMGGELVAAEFLETAEAFAALWPGMLKGYGLSSMYAAEKEAPGSAGGSTSTTSGDRTRRSTTGRPRRRTLTTGLTGGRGDARSPVSPRQPES